MLYQLSYEVTDVGSRSIVGVKMAPKETEDNAYAKFGRTNKEHYGMLWYFLEWSISAQYRVRMPQSRVCRRFWLASFLIRSL